MSDPQRCALAVDLGTTAAKVAVVGIDGTVLGSGTRAVTTVFGRDGRAEQEPEAVWNAVVDAAREAVRDAGARAAACVEVICATSQWSSIVPVDVAGTPVGPMVMWLDRRGSGRQSGVGHGDPSTGARWEAIHGLRPSTSLGHVLRMQLDCPDIHRAAAAYLEPMDYLNARLCGRIAATGCSAMPLALTDNRSVGSYRWSPELVELSGVDASKLPPIVASLTVLGPVLDHVADDMGIPRGASVVAGANDSIAAAIGTDALEPGQATVVMGTTGVLTGHHPARVIAMDRFIGTMPSALADRYYVMAEAGLGGKVLETFLADVVHDGAPPADLYAGVSEIAASVEPGADGVLFLPWLFGSASPRVDGRLRGAFLGMSLGTSRAQLLRAVLEGVSMQMRWLTDEVEAALGVRYRSVRFAGGGAQSDVWAQIMADVLGRTVEQIAEPRHANARGAGLLGFLSIGALRTGELRDLVPIRGVYEPAAEQRPLFDDRVALHRELHGLLAEPFARLARAGQHPNDPDTA
jgi:xylulokinase